MNRVLAIKKCRLLTHLYRNISSDIFANELNHGIRKEIEEYWSKRLLRRGGEEKFFTALALHPSTKLNVEDMRLLVINDSIIRYHQMNDRQVCQSVYWQLHQAVENRCQSFSQLQKLVQDTKRHLDQLRLITSDRELRTDSADVSHRIQYLFLQLYHASLIYQKKTIMDDHASQEQVKMNETTKLRKLKNQAKISKRWFLKTSKFAQDLYRNLCSKNGYFVDDLVNLHKSWIGKCNGFSFDCETNTNETLNIWVPTLSLVPLAEFIAVKPNSLFDIMSEEGKNSNGKLRINVVNPFTNQELPVYVTEDVVYPPGRDTYLGIPSAHENDRKFAESVRLEMREYNAGSCQLKDVNQLAETLGLELSPVNSQLNDWMISRSENLGVPAPFVNCCVCGVQPITLSELPLIAPSIPEGLMRENVEMFLENDDWARAICPKCGGEAKRDRNFIDPMFSSAMLNLRFDGTKQFSPVDLYVHTGDKAPLQLYFTRFLSYILYSLALFPSPDPSKKMLHRHSLPYQTFETADKMRKKSDITNVQTSFENENESDPKQTLSSDIWNVYGCDATRLLLLFPSKNENGQYEQQVPTEMLTWQNNLWLTLREFLKIRERPLASVSPWINIAELDQDLKRTRNECIRLTTFNLHVTHDIKACIVALRKLTNKLRTYTRDARKFSVEYERTLAALIIMLTPIMPHFAATLWMALTAAEGKLEINDDKINWNECVGVQKWPKVDSDYEIPLILRVNSTHFLTGGSLLCNEVPQLTVDSALEVGKKSRDVRKFLRRNRIVDVHLQTFQNLHAELILTTEKEQSIQEICS